MVDLLTHRVRHCPLRHGADPESIITIAVMSSGFARSRFGTTVSGIQKHEAAAASAATAAPV
jgi:hypothetical protein